MSHNRETTSRGLGESPDDLGEAEDIGAVVDFLPPTTPPDPTPSLDLEGDFSSPSQYFRDDANSGVGHVEIVPVATAPSDSPETPPSRRTRVRKKKPPRQEAADPVDDETEICDSERRTLQWEILGLERSLARLTTSLTASEESLAASKTQLAAEKKMVLFLHDKHDRFAQTAREAISELKKERDRAKHRCGKLEERVRKLQDDKKMLTSEIRILQREQQQQQRSSTTRKKTQQQQQPHHHRNISSSRKRRSSVGRSLKQSEAARLRARVTSAESRTAQLQTTHRKLLDILRLPDGGHDDDHDMMIVGGRPAAASTVERDGIDDYDEDFLLDHARLCRDRASQSRLNEKRARVLESEMSNLREEAAGLADEKFVLEELLGSARGRGRCYGAIAGVLLLGWFALGLFVASQVLL